jgi:hypothetical protein
MPKLEVARCDECQRVGDPERDVGWREVRPLGRRVIGRTMLPRELTFCGDGCEAAYMGRRAQAAPTRRLPPLDAPAGEGQGSV